MPTKSIFSDALRQTERRTWELWDAVQTASREIAAAARGKKVTGTVVDIRQKVQELVGDYASELIPTITDQIQEYAEADSPEPFYLKSATRERFLMPATRTQPRSVVADGDAIAVYGGAVKALGGGRVGGYLVLFSGANDPDLQGDYFTKDTDFFIDSGESRPILYRHGAHPVVKSKRLGSAKVTIDEVGVFVDGELDLRDKYIRAIYSLAEKGQLGWSSGSMSHLIQRAPNGKAFEIKSWALGECSLTPAPVEARTSAFPLKELLLEDDHNFDEFVKALDQEETDQQFSIEGIPSIKAFCEAVAPSSLKDGSHRSQSAANAVKEFITISKILGEAYDSYASRLVKRTESRFLKQGREIDASTVSQVESTLVDMEKLSTAFQSIKDALSGIKQISEMTANEQRAMDQKARRAVWNYCRIAGLTPEEISDARTTGTS